MSVEIDDHEQALADQLGGQDLLAHEPPSLDAMRRASGIADEDLLDSLIKLGVRPDGLTLMSLAPLVAVAWADGEVQEGEREAILRVASGKGIVPGTATFNQLARWLTVHPGEDLLDAWELFVKDITKKWDFDKADRFKAQLGGLARTVAQASGGFLGIGAVSAAEAGIIARVEGAFDLTFR